MYRVRIEVQRPDDEEPFVYEALYTAQFMEKLGDVPEALMEALAYGNIAIEEELKLVVELADALEAELDRA